ncbi:thyroid adenoma-associated protein homolog [Gigantopelta aegis]|uniref:thyroid adenoma-associated protein homolog n=1 Tax=Gigantopelta aegis TaxID=1735272 RepID=UPI001B889DB9|nr:thyroid adenoma-associated protein homolog [Gigantopelta aegis]
MDAKVFDGNFSECLKSLLEVGDSKAYIQTLKKALAEIKTDEKHLSDPVVCEFITSIYFKCKQKNPVRRVLISYIESLTSTNKSTLKGCLQHQLLQQLDLPNSDMSNISLLRCRVDTISALMDNFPTGEECLGSVALRVLQFLAHSLSSILHIYSETLSPVQMNEIMHHCLVTIQSSNRLLQKYVAMTTKTCSEQESHELHEMIMQYLESDVFILVKDDFLTDCRCGCAMNIALLLKLTVADNVPHLLMSVMFPHINPSHDLAPYTLPDWLAVGDITKLEVANLSLVSQLCLIFGFIAKLDLPELMVEITPGKPNLISVFLDQLLTFSKRCSDTSSKVLLAKTMALWTSRMCTGLECKCVPCHLHRSLSGKGSIVKEILQYIWTAWDDQIDVIRQNAKNTFESSIKIHILASQTDAKTDTFIQSVTRELLNVNWSNKGKYGALASMVTILTVSGLLELRPLIATELIEQLKEQMSASQASDLYDRLCRSHQAECTSPKTSDPDCETKWLTLWCQPVISALCGDHRPQKTTIIEYVLPKLLKTSKTVLPYIIKQLTVTVSPSRSQTYALITCLRRARCLGQLHHSVESSESGETTLWYGLVRIDVLKFALTSVDDQVRLDAFALLCENNKTTEPISELEFDLVQYFLPFNLNNQSPAFRQHLLSYVQKLFHRLKESWQTLARHVKRGDETKCDEAATNMAVYQDFLHWLKDLMFTSVHLGSAFPRRTTCLGVLLLMVNSAQQMSKLCTDHLFVCVYQLGDSHTQILLDCLMDTFEENKMAASKILSACMKHGFGYQTQVESLFKSALELSTSNKPQDCTTAAYLFQYLLQQPSILVVMKTYASSLTTRLFARDDPVMDRCPPLLLLSILLMLLREQLSVARRSLTSAAANGPMYPTLHCIRYILSEINYKSVSTEYLVSWRELFDDLIHLCLDLSKVVSPVVQASSPEGNVPLDIIQGLNLDGNTNETSSKDSSDKLVTLMPEFLVVCCWRTIKEVSLVFGYICQNVPVVESSPQHGVINTHQLLLIGDYFKNQLLESIHRGAFELAYAGFVQMCDMLWRSSVQQLHQLPSQWLQAVLSDVRGNNSTLCATRRSAGVPFYVQALVSTEPSLTGRTCFKSAMTALLCLALKSDDCTDAQVHSLNILRALFRDTRLGEDVSPYITDGLTAAVLGFKSKNWAVRNSSTLLLSALMTRVFGVKRSKDESSISKKNCQTGRAFFHRYPALYQFLLQELTEATQNIDCSEHNELHPSLYPVLMVLGRLFPSSLEGADTNLNLAAFIPYIIKCASSPVYKTRMMAAKALQPLVQKDQLICVILQLIRQLPTSSANQIKQSCVHGYLLQIELLLVIVRNSQSDFLQEHTLHTVTSAWMRCLWLVSRANTCLVTRKSGFDICDLLLSLGSTEHPGTDSLHQAVVDTLRLEVSWEPIDTPQPFVEEFMTTVAHLCLKYIVILSSTERNIEGQLQDDCIKESRLPEDEEKSQLRGDDLKDDPQVLEHSPQKQMENLILTLLSSKLYEVRLAVLTTLNNHFSHESVKEEQDHDTSRHYFFNPAIVRCCQTKQVFEKLLTMALHTEWHHACLALVFETLKTYPSIHSLIKHSDIKEIFRLLLQRLMNEQRSEVKSSIIDFSGVALSAVYSHLTQVRSCELYRYLTEWCRCISRYSQSDHSCHVQTSCAKAIQDNAVSLLVDPNNVLDCLTFDVWEVVVSLLQEDDLEVKDVTSAIVLVLDGRSHLTDVQPTLVLKLLLAKMVDIHGGRNKVGCMSTLITWIKKSDSACEHQEERLFDRGEINTYREDVLFVQLVAKQLEKVTQQAFCCDGHFTGKSSSDASQSKDNEKSADQKSEDESVRKSSGDTSQMEVKGKSTDQKLVDNFTSMYSGDTSQREDKGIKIKHESVDHSMRKSSVEAAQTGDTVKQAVTEPDDSCIEALFCDLLEYFCVKVNDLDVISPVSPFTDSAVFESSLKTLLIAATVVKCTRHISKSGTLQSLHDQLQQAVNSRCDPSHTFLDGCL